MVPGIRRNPHYSPSSRGATATATTMTIVGGTPPRNGAYNVRSRTTYSQPKKSSAPHSHPPNDGVAQLLASYQEQEPTLHNEIMVLKQKLKRTGQYAEEMEAERNNAHHNMTIWQGKVEEQQEVLDERDNAIEKLVNRSLQGDRSASQEVQQLQEVNVGLTKQVAQAERVAAEHEHSLHQSNAQLDAVRHQVSQLHSTNQQNRTVQHCQVSNLQMELTRLRQQMASHQRDAAGANQRASLLEREHRDTSDLTHKLQRLTSETESQQDELRSLKRQLWKAKESSGEVHDLQHALALAREQIQQLQATRQAAVEEATRSAQDQVRHELEVAEGMHRLLEGRLQEMEAVHSTKKGTPSRPGIPTTTLSSRDASTVSSASAEEMEPSATKIHVQQLESRIQSLTSQLHAKTSMLETSETTGRHMHREWEAAKKEHSQLLNQLEDLKQLQHQQQSSNDGLEQARRARESSEKSIVHTYERRMTDMSAAKDSTIDELRTDLSAVRAKRAEEVADLNLQLAELRAEHGQIHEKYEQELDLKDQQIFALEHTLHAQEQTVDTMRDEMDQLQKVMQETANSRRTEVEDLEEEVMSLRAMRSQHDKEVTTIRMQLQEEKLEHRAQVLNLKEMIAELEHETPMVKAMANIKNDQRMLMVQERLDQLKLRNHELKDDNQKLGQRLEKAIIKIHKFEAEKSETDAAKVECVTLRQQVSHLQEIVDQTQCPTEVASLPENYELLDLPLALLTSRGPVPSASLSGKPCQPEIDADRKKSSSHRLRGSASFKRLFKRRVASAATTAAHPTAVKTAKFDPTRQEVSNSTTAGGLMFF